MKKVKELSETGKALNLQGQKLEQNLTDTQSQLSVNTTSLDGLKSDLKELQNLKDENMKSYSDISNQLQKQHQEVSQANLKIQELDKELGIHQSNLKSPRSSLFQGRIGAGKAKN